MSESLLSFSEVLLFGRVVGDLQIDVPERPIDETADVATHVELTMEPFAGHPEIDGVQVQAGNVVLVHLQSDKTKNGLYTIPEADDANWGPPQRIDKGKVVYVKEGGDEYGDTFWQQVIGAPGKQKYREVPRYLGRGLGRNNLLDIQLGKDARFARIYGFAYEGTFYELPEPVIFLVHGEGESATSWENGGVSIPENAPGRLHSRAPNKPPLSGVAAADFQIADDIQVWPYDKADYTIRMDVATGMFEQVLLDIFFEVDLPMMAGAKVSGAKVAGAKVAGAKVSGAKVSGAKVAGAKVSGAKVGGFGD